MPNIDIDPATLGFSDSVTTANPASLSLSKTNGFSAQPSLKAIKTVNTAQRIDFEPLYTSLKAAIGDNWGFYKDAFNQFMLGMRLLLQEFPQHATVTRKLTTILTPRSTKPERVLLPSRSLHHRGAEC